MNDIQKMKRNLRATKAWKEFRKKLKKEQKIDPLTKRPLTNSANLHHRDLNPEHYEDLSDSTHFVMYNKKTHDTIHYLYDIASKCGIDELIDRLRDELDAMFLINNN